MSNFVIAKHFFSSCKTKNQIQIHCRDKGKVKVTLRQFDKLNLQMIKKYYERVNDGK